MAEKRNNEVNPIPVDEVTLLNIDTAVYNWFDVKHPTVINDRKVQSIFGSWERFAQMQGNKTSNKLNSMRDHNGRIKLPIISLRRVDVTPNEQRYRKITKDGEPSITFHKEIAASKFDKDRRVPFKNKWLIGPSNRDVKMAPVYAHYSLPFPTFVNIPYEVTFWSSYANHASQFHDKIWSDYRLPDLEFNGHFFYSYFDSSSDQSNLEDFSTDERMFRHMFILNVEAYLIDKGNVRIDRSVSRFIFEEQIVDANEQSARIGEITSRNDSLVFIDPVIDE